MTLVMDGVRPTSAKLKPVVMPKLKPAVQSRSAVVRRYVVGMDGIRRPAPVTPREMLANLQPAEAVAEIQAPAWRMPSLRMPSIAWKRPAMAFGLVATALVASSVAAFALATPRTTTARAETTKTVAPTPVQTKVAAVAPAPTPQKTGLQQLLSEFAAANGDKFGIVVKDLKTGETASVNPDREMTSASLYKLFVAQRIYQQIDLGQLTYGAAAGGGSGRDIDGCLTVMINISDNTCGRALGDILHWGAQNQALAVEGYKETDLSTPQQTSAADVATLFSRLYNGTLVSANSSARFMALLKDQRVNNRLPVGLPAGTVIAHKTGDLNSYVHDAGIVYGPKTDYLVVAMSGSWNAPGNAPALFGDLSGKLWNYFEQ
jgi:beta-lactamase class A